MTEVSPHVSLYGSRLVRFLTDLAVSDVELSHKCLAQRIGQLINFSDSVALSSLHGQLPTMAFEPLSIPAEAIQKEFLRVRQTLVQSIVNSFVPGTTRIQFPVAKTNAPDTLITYEPYERFYVTQQREIDHKFQYLQSYVRDAASGLSPRLAQLVALDTALGDTLSAHGRQLFAVIPKLLGKRFEHLLNKQLGQPHQQDDDSRMEEGPDVWLATFRSEMQGLLLAELEARLLPVLGLIEAINEEADKNHD